MAKLVEDNRVFTAAAGNVSSADLNSLQDQLKGIVKELSMDVTGLFVNDLASGSTWQPYNNIIPADNRERHWATGAAPAAEEMWCVLPIRVGSKITKVDITFFDGARNGGFMELRRKQDISVGAAAQLNASTQVTDFDTVGAGNPWNYGDGNWHRVSTAVNHVVVEDYEYLIRIVSSTWAGVGDLLARVVVYYQMGN